MPIIRILPAALLAAAATCASAQLNLGIQERNVSSHAEVSSGASLDDYHESLDFNPFIATATSSVSGAGGASATGIGGQNSLITSSLISADISADCAVATGSTFITGSADANSHFLVFFELTSPTPVSFQADASFTFVGFNPDGEPSDLYSFAQIQLIDANSFDPIAGFQIRSDQGPGGSDSFSGVLPAGQYAILANIMTHAFSADLLGPPPRSGSGEATGSFSFAVVPAPGAAGLLALGALAARRRR